MSTHVVEVVAQTCRETAVMASGRVRFTGPVVDLIERAEGATWEVATTGHAPSTGVVVSAVGNADGTRYRVVSAEPPAPEATPVAPMLEEGYVAFMQMTR